MSDRSSAGASTAGERVRRALLRPRRGQVLVAVLLGLLAFAAVTQVRVHEQPNAYASLRQSDLIEALNGLSAARSRTEAEIEQLQQTRDRLQNNSDKRASAIDQAQHDVATLGILAGTLPATGPGIRIVVNDPEGHYRVNHLLNGIEELRDAGAEAIQLNGRVRVIAQTSFEAGSGGIMVDGTLLSPPYTIDVIGDPTTLQTALSFPGGFLDEVALDGGTANVTKVDSVHIDVVRAARPAQYASPSANP